MEILNTVLICAGIAAGIVVALWLLFTVIVKMAEASIFISEVPQGMGKIFVDYGGNFEVFIINDPNRVVDRKTGIITPKQPGSKKPWKVPFFGYYFIGTNFLLRPYNADVKYVSTESVPAKDGKPAQLLDRDRIIKDKLPLEESLRIWATNMETAVAQNNNTTGFAPGSIKADVGLLITVQADSLADLYGRRLNDSSPWTNVLDEVVQASARAVLTGLEYTSVSNAGRALEEKIKTIIEERLSSIWPSKPLTIVNVQINEVEPSTSNDPKTLEAFTASQTLNAVLAQKLAAAQNDRKIAEELALGEAAQAKALANALGGDNENGCNRAANVIAARLQAEAIKTAQPKTLVLGGQTPPIALPPDEN